MDNKVISHINPFSYSVETNNLMACINAHIEDENIKIKAINYINRERLKIIKPELYWDFLSWFDGMPADKEDVLLNLIRNSSFSSYKFYLDNFKKYTAYCKKLFQILGIYSLEDPLVRQYIFMTLGKGNTLTTKDKNNLQKSLLNIFSKKEQLRVLSKIKNSYLKSDKDFAKSAVYYAKTTTDESFRSIGRALSIDHKTAQTYFNEVRDMPDEERVEFLKARRKEDIHDVIKVEVQPIIGEESDDPFFKDE